MLTILGYILHVQWTSITKLLSNVKSINLDTNYYESI